MHNVNQLAHCTPACFWWKSISKNIFKNTSISKCAWHCM